LAAILNAKLLHAAITVHVRQITVSLSCLSVIIAFYIAASP